jgi:hypothetical protein
MSESMSENECLSCRKRAGAYECVECENPVCKPCSESLSDPLFVSLEQIPEASVAGRFCGQCFDRDLAPRIEAYRATMEAAKQVFVFFKTQRKHIPLIRKAKVMVKVDECIDRDETILRLAYYAAKEEYNAIVDVDVDGKKVRAAGSTKTATWKGSGFPALVDAAKVNRQDMQEQLYR